MKRPLWTVLLGCIPVMWICGAGTAKAESLADVRAELAKVMEQWTQLRDLVIDIEAIDGGSSSRDPKEQLRQRLETLLAKQQSNRVWRRYWEREQSMSDHVARLYEVMAPLDTSDATSGLLEAEVAALAEKHRAKKTALEEALGSDDPWLRLMGAKRTNDAASFGVLVGLAEDGGLPKPIRTDAVRALVRRHADRSLVAPGPTW